MWATAASSCFAHAVVCPLLTPYTFLGSAGVFYSNYADPMGNMQAASVTRRNTALTPAYSAGVLNQVGRPEGWGARDGEGEGLNRSVLSADNQYTPWLLAILPAGLQVQPTMSPACIPRHLEFRFQHPTCS